MQLVRPLLHIASSSIVDCGIRTPTGMAIFVDEIVMKFYMTVVHKKMCTPGSHWLYLESSCACRGYIVDDIVLKFYMTVVHKKMWTPGRHRLFGILARMQRLNTM